MPTPLAPRKPHALPRVKPQAAAESFLLKSVLVVSALFLGAFVVASEGIYFSAPGRSLSEVEASLLLAKHAAAARPIPPSN